MTCRFAFSSGLALAVTMVGAAISVPVHVEEAAASRPVLATAEELQGRVTPGRRAD
jgi:hypothetical protein